MELSGKTILITGAAGRIGSTTARLSLAAGGDVIISDINETKLESLKKELQSDFNRYIYSIPSDVTTENGIDELLHKTCLCTTKLSSVVHSAYPISAGWGGKFEDLDQANLNKDLAMQLGGAILISKKFLSYFSANGGGDLIHISSIQGIRAPKFYHYEGTKMTSPIEYSAIKAGIISITKWLAKYYADRGIRVNCVSPGGIMAGQPDSFLEKYRKSCTNIGMLTADHVAKSIVFLLSPASSAINGHNLIVDDGWSL
jgi:NAD(P)-dependent dehydrogenase (short-subunit alcohol dehydrogenase family)